jgi:hypothetical protein
MKFLGRGWQYTVYDIGNGRVLKKWNSKSIAYLVMLQDCFPYIKSPIWGFYKNYLYSVSMAQDSMRKLTESNLDKKLFGNPEYGDNGLDYEQDILQPIDIYLKNVSVDKGKKIIDKFVEFNKLLIANNCIDKSFNIGKNFALNNDNNIVLSDIGELYFSKESIKKQITKKAWKAHYVLKHIPKELRTYFIEKMETLTNLL